VVETTPHNLYLTTKDLQEKGSWVTFAPPVRDPASADGLWELLRDGFMILLVQTTVRLTQKQKKLVKRMFGRGSLAYQKVKHLSR